MVLRSASQAKSIFLGMIVLAFAMVLALFFTLKDADFLFVQFALLMMSLVVFCGPVVFIVMRLRKRRKEC
ncbi:hypothetical protein APS58_p00036 (plasmid) [Paracidovorax citrulli]|nr:hypothetical protein APS58_p00036 [Paracidovorax citrulli]